LTPALPHRAVTSNVFVPLAGAAVWQWCRVKRPDRAIYAAVATYYLASHLLMDLFAGGIVLFWPVWDQNFFFHFEVVVDTLTNRPITDFEAGTEPGAPPVARYFQWISAFETAMVALTVATLLVVLALRRARRQREVYLEEMREAPTRSRRSARAKAAPRRTRNR
ncbi:MAG: hypothetical protein ACREI7_09055, partial [Myxococcota bacterium]